jgi:thiamine biosynthesis lipoprotein
MPEDTFLSVSVLAKNSAVADALSTSLFNMSLEDGRALVEAEGGIEAMWILSDGSVAYSSSFEAYIVGGSSK